VNFPENPENYGRGSWGRVQGKALVGDQGPKPPKKYEIRGLPDHPQMKIFTLFLGIKVLMSTSNFMIFQGVEYYKTGNASEYPRLLSYNVCICFVFLLLSTNIDTPDKVVFFLRVWVHLTWLVSSLWNRNFFFPEFPYFIVLLHMMQKQQPGTSTLTRQSLHVFPSSTVLFIQPRPSPTVC